MKMLLTLIVALLAGCGASEADNNNHSYGDHYDQLGTEGMRFRYSPTLTTNDPRSRVSTYENIFKEVEECTGIYAPQPFLIIVPRGSLSPDAGRYWSKPSLIIIEANDVENIFGDAIMLKIFRHEVIHYLLDMNTGNLDPSHVSELFTNCT